MKLTQTKRDGKPVYVIDGVEVSRSTWDATWAKIKAQRARFGGEVESGQEVGTLHRPACWPQVSTAMGCHPDQVAEANSVNQMLGLKCFHQPDGKLVIPDRAERAKYMKALKLRDNDSVHTGNVTQV